MSGKEKKKNLKSKLDYSHVPRQCTAQIKTRHQSAAHSQIFVVDGKSCRTHLNKEKNKQIQNFSEKKYKKNFSIRLEFCDQESRLCIDGNDDQKNRVHFSIQSGNVEKKM